MKILITGSTGFIGKNLINYFDQSIALAGLNRKSDQLLSENYSWDHLQNIPLDKFQAVIHLAGMAHDLKNTSDDAAYYKVNEGLTKKVFDYFLQSTASHFIFMSSVKAAADNVPGILTENKKPEPKTAYGKSKLMAEEYIFQKQLPEGKNVYILRPCMIHGPGNKGNLNLLYQFVKKGLPYPLGAFESRRSFLSVDNLCFVINQILNNPSVPSGIYQVADDEVLSTTEVVKLMSKVLDKKAVIWNISPKIIKSAAQLGNHLHLPLNTERLKKLTENYIVANDKIKQALAIERLPLKAKDGMLKTLEGFGG